MRATDMLKDEHRVIERVLSVLEQASDRVNSGGNVRPGFFLDAADFISEFADGCHHRKEEGVLFKVMEDAGLPSQGGPIAVMLAEHDQARGYTRSMREAAARWQRGDEGARTEVTHAATAYARLLRQHIAKEDQILFPLADRVIPSSRRGEVVAEFERVEASEERAGLHEKYLAVADALEQEAGGWS
jgi:hemerythrin-like domain-containing protein